ncbi:MAG: hypothetical protein ABJC61_06940 [Acidobacteriota bacterium]
MNTNTGVTMTLGANTTLVIVGWTPVVNSMSAAFGSINAYVNCTTCTLADLNNFTGQSPTAHVGQFTAAAGPPIILYPAWQQNGQMHLNNNLAATKSVLFGCVGGAVTGACLFNVRTVPSADPLF